MGVRVEVGYRDAHASRQIIQKLHLLVLVVAAADNVELIVEHGGPEVAGLDVGDGGEGGPDSLIPALVVETK